MKNYDPDIQWGTHTIKVSFQQWDYKGYVTLKRGGNCKGLGVLRLDVDDLYEQQFVENIANLIELPASRRSNEWFSMTLKNDKDELVVEDEWDYLGDYIVGVEIVDFTAEQEKSK